MCLCLVKDCHCQETKEHVSGTLSKLAPEEMREREREWALERGVRIMPRLTKIWHGKRVCVVR